MQGEITDRPEAISLGGRDYLLMPQSMMGSLAGNPKRWSIQSVPAAVTRYPRPGLRPGDLDGQWVQTIDDWSKGLGSVDETRPGRLLLSEGLNGFTPGTLRQNAAYSTLGITAASSIDPTSESSIPLQFSGELYILSGRYVTKVSPQGAIAVDVDFTAGVRGTTMCVWNSKLLVGFGGSTKIQIRSGGSWAAAAGNVYADHLAMWGDRLQRITDVNEWSNLANGADEGVLANWSGGGTGITVGDSSYGCTGLWQLPDGRAVVSKPEGVFVGDASAKFSNVLPQFVDLPDPRNKIMAVAGDVVIYRHSHGVVLWRDGASPVEVGIEPLTRAIALAQGNMAVHGWEMLSAAVQGEYIWGCFAPSGYPAFDPTGFKKTVNNGAAYTSYTTEVTDNSSSTSAALGSLDTVANQDWVILGYSAAFDGASLELVATNSVSSVMTIEYWNGAWTAAPMAMDLTVASAMTSPSVRGAATLSRSGRIWWNRNAMSDWVSSVIDGTDAFWIRLSVSAALSTTVSVREARVIIESTNFARASGWLMRGRAARADDQTDKPIVWEPYSHILGNFHPSGITIVDERMYPFVTGGSVFVSGNATWNGFPLSSANPNTVGYYQQQSSATYGWSPLYDFGTPTLQKTLVALRARIQGYDAGNYITWSFYSDDDTGAAASWTLSTEATQDDDAFVSTATASFVGTAFNRTRLLYDFGVANADSPQVLELFEMTVQEQKAWKKQFECVLLVEDGSTLPLGGSLPEARVQLTNLEALRGTRIDIIDGLRREVAFTVNEVNELEHMGNSPGMTRMAVQIKAAES